MAQAKRKTADQNPESEWFGFRRVRPEDKASLVGDVFASVAGNYDLMNDLMSGGLHRLWKDRLVSLMDPKPGQVILDVAGGTGDIALRCYRRTEGKARITVCDINPAMLKAGKAKVIDHGVLSGIDWITGNAEELPLASRSVDTYCIGFGLRNVTHIDKALAETARVLKPGGRFFCLEFSPGVRREIKPLYDRYCLDVLPRIGQFVAKDAGAYRYLAESIMKFPPQAELAKRMEKAGLSQAKWLNLTGGIAVIHQGWRL
ncbi:MAG TPA: class I SAM-dependent methyltransferase [Alphaproteobacteria bacterium]|nr:class I SAM-dependent methyltransferase [Alphaproteobacteria bacterium]